MKSLLTPAIFVLLFALASISHAENKLFPGYIITLDNDTIVGYIDYKNWEINPSHVLFKIIEDGKYVKYTPESILEFYAANEIYVSATVKIEQSPFKTNDLTLSPKFQFKTETVFLRAVILGEKELLYLKDSRGKDNFYIKQGAYYKWLMYKIYLRNENGSKVLTYNNKYVGQLILYFQDCKGINPELSKTEYNFKSLKKAFEYYYSCTDKIISYKPKKEKVVINFSVMAGVTMTSLKLGGDNAPVYFTDGDFAMSTNITGGIALDIVLPRNSGRWSFNNELIINQYSTNGTYKDVTRENWHITTDIDLAFTYLKLNNMLRGNFPINKMVLFVDLGFSNGFVISNTNHKTTTKVFYDDVDITNGEAIPDLRKHEQSLLIGIGGKLNKLAAELRYERGNGFGSQSYVWTATNRFYLLFSYTF
ncbi:MAG: outer membrane beta-barrel protein [Bacteroidota bacterium]